MISQKIFTILRDKVRKFNLLLGILSIGSIFLLRPIIAHADYIAPTWWNNDQCDTTHYTSINTGDTPAVLAS